MLRRREPRLGVELLEDRVTPADIWWTGAGGNNLWENALNWDQNVLPTLDDNVLLGTAGTIVIGSQAAAEANTISGGYALVVHGSLTVDNSFPQQLHYTVDGSLTLLPGAAMSALSLDLSGQLHLGAGTVFNVFESGVVHGNQAAIEGSGTLNLSGTMNWTGGNLASPGGTFYVAADAELNIETATTLGIDGWTINNAGTIDWLQGDINADSATLNIESGGIVNITGTRTWNDLDEVNRSTINNAGTLTVSVNSNPETNNVCIEAALITSGTVDIVNGDLELRGGGEFAGDVNTVAESHLLLTKGYYFVQAQDQNVRSFGSMTIVVRFRGPFDPLLPGEFVEFDSGPAGTTSQIRNLSVEGGGALITGSGTMRVSETFFWGGVTKSAFAEGQTPAQGTLIALPSCSTVWDFDSIGDDDIPSLGNFRFYNEGNLQWLRGTIKLEDNGEIINSGVFQIYLTTSARTATLQQAVGNAFLNRGSFTNLESGEVLVRGTADNGATSSVKIAVTHFENYGSVSVSDAALTFEGNGIWNNTGYFVTNNLSRVIFKNGEYTFDTDPISFILNGGLYQLGGSGVYQLEDNANWKIPADHFMYSTNVVMQSGSTISGAGDFSAKNLTWHDGARMVGAEIGASGTGSTTIESAGMMGIFGDPLLRQRALIVKGAAEWNDGQEFKIEKSAQIIIDSGSFDIFARSENRIYKVDDELNGQIIVKNNGIFRVNATENSVTTLIDLEFVNNNSRLQIDGSVMWYNRGSLFSQIGTDALTSFGTGSYDVFSASFTRGTILLNNGSLTLPNSTDRLSECNLRLSGSVSGFNTRLCSIYLIGGLSMTGSLSFVNSDLLLGGFDFVVTGSISCPAGSRIYLQEGTITTTGPFGPGNNVQPDPQRVIGNGSINGQLYGD